ILGGELGDGRVFLCNSGTEAIEGALKLAAVLGGKRREIVACRRAFHGRSCGALGLTFNPKYRAPFTSLIPAAKHYAPEDIPAKISNETLAVFIEPVQGGRRLSHSRRGGTGHHRLPRAWRAADRRRGDAASAVQLLSLRRKRAYAGYHCLAKGLAGGMPAGIVWRGELGDFPPHSHGSTAAATSLQARLIAALKYIKKTALPQRRQARL
ncbi:MAG: aminotransferase class III-fold pyridoxal phosphate-dependent enzyme, partial [Cloacibacillus evryensis]